MKYIERFMLKQYYIVIVNFIEIKCIVECI